MKGKAVSGIVFSLFLLAVSIAASDLTLARGSYSVQPPVFRLLAIEQMFNNHRMRSAQFLVQSLLNFPNWNNITGVSHIHLLSLYNHSEVFEDVKPFWQGTLSDKTVKNEIIDFLGDASPGEIVILYYCGHSNTRFIPPPPHSEFMGISPNELRGWLNSTLSQAYLTLILDTCYSGYWIDFSVQGTILAACGKNQAAWGGDCGIFTMGLIEGFHMANESNNDGWLSTAEVFPYTKNYTETVVTWDDQNPESYYGAVEGDLPIIQRDITKPFPRWDIAILSMLADPLRVEPESTMIINVTVENQGVKPASFPVNVYANSSVMLTQQITLLPEEVANVTFTWFPMEAYGLYPLSSTVSICPGETDTSDNVCYGPQVTIALKADTNIDGIVDIRDISRVASAYGESPGRPRWNPEADINQDGIVDIRDIVLVAMDFGKTWK